MTEPKAQGSMVVSLAAAGLVGWLAAGDWPQFRGPGGTAVAPEAGVPVHWGPEENVRWKADLPGRGVSSPVVAGGRVYVTACTGFTQDRLHVLCLDAVTGKRCWERQFWATGSTMCSPRTCMAAPTPASDGAAVYALFGSGDLAALDAEGNLLWYRALALDHPRLANQVGMAASPVLWNDVLILALENAGDSLALGLDRHTGRDWWKVTRPRTVNWVTPAFRTGGAGPEVLLQSWGEISAYDPATGARRWTYTGEGPTSVPTPLAAGRLVVTPDGVALDPEADPAGPVGAWKAPKLRTTYASALHHDGHVYAINASSILTCAEAATGQVLWQLRLPGTYFASPVLVVGKLYAVNEEGTTTVVEPGDPPRVLATNPLGEGVLATPAVAGGALYFRSDRHLYCIGTGPPR